MARAFHGTGEQAIEWILNVSGSYETDEFLRAWQQGDAEREWSDFYKWLDAQTEPEGPKLRDGSADAALAISEHAFLAGWDAGRTNVQEGIAGEPKTYRTAHDAWSAYEPPQHIKDLA